MMMQTEQAVSCCPSFSTYDDSSETLSQIATRVIRELHSSDPDSLFLHSSSQPQNDDVPDDDEFEFCFVPRDTDSSPVSADDIFHNGHITPTFPLFDTSLLNPQPLLPPPRRSPLRNLMFEEDGVPDGTYCLWTPPSKKSSSAGSSSSKRWKLRDLLLRSHSDGAKRSNKVAPKHTADKEVEQAKKKATFLPSRQELVGLFSNGNGIGRNSQKN